MPAKTIRTNLGLCGVDDCEDCWVDMRVCLGCGNGPLNDDEDDCGECQHPGYCCTTLARSGVCSCPDREQNIGW